MFAGKAGAEVAAQPETAFTGKIMNNNKCDICGRPAPYHWDDLHWCPLHTDTVWRSSGGPTDWTIHYEDQQVD